MAALKHGSRKFYDIPSEELSNVRTRYNREKEKNVEELLNYIDQSCIGKDVMFSGPYGARTVTYCDYTASGRSLTFIEDYIREQVLPHYGNTHTTTTVTSLQTTLYRHEARDIIRNAVNASESDSVVFVGNGVTGAVHKLIHALDFRPPPIVFVGPFEHHSNLLPWKELGAEFHSSKGRQLIGCFSAASNVTGILTDTNAVTACLHRNGALAFWDYATAGPYVDINMNPLVTSDDQGLVYKDAIFISTHKFVGGVETPGILVAKKSLFVNPVPSGCGGGSVFFVSTEKKSFDNDNDADDKDLTELSRDILSHVAHTPNRVPIKPSVSIMVEGSLSEHLRKRRKCSATDMGTSLSVLVGGLSANEEVGNVVIVCGCVNLNFFPRIQAV